MQEEAFKEAVPRARLLFKEAYECFSLYSFRAATNILKSAEMQSLGYPWSQYIEPLLRFVTCEQLYYKLTYLRPRYVKDDYLNKLYLKVVSDLNRLIREQRKLTHELSSREEVQRGLLFFSRLLYETGIVVALREEMATLYKTLALSRGGPTYRKQSVIVNAIRKQIQIGITHPFLHACQGNFMAELSSIHSLFQAQEEMQRYQYMESVTSLYQAKSHLKKWRSAVTSFNYSERDADRLPILSEGLYKWLFSFHSAMLSKFSLYFRQVLVREEKMTERLASSFVSKLELSYNRMMQSFGTKSGCRNVALFFSAGAAASESNLHRSPSMDSTKFSLQLAVPPTPPQTPSPSPRTSGRLPFPRTKRDMLGDTSHSPISTTEPGQGYVFPDTNREELRGLKSWPALISYPEPTPPLEHMPSLVSLLIDNEAHLSLYREPVYFSDPRSKATYFVSKVDEFMYLTIIYDSQKPANDRESQGFLYIMSTHLRNWKLFEKLNPKRE
eukprot:TRINITY_DN9253_c0_g1_i1.p1 TRINITY_DN9253_c0_g1~~TRINITY_DN9253_c0_g1_i1.p1  ORF type:complete len:506 (+),score=88.88 TRINITY_DN9253_c0_g1_i1:23-1519(+)